MTYLRKFNESLTDDAVDYLSVEIDESRISFIDKQEEFLFVIYDNVLKFEYESLLKYINGVRFNKYECLFDYDQGRVCLLVVGKDFYDRNKKCLYDNIEWIEHPLFTELKKSQISSIDLLADKYKNAQKAINLPEGVSIIRNLDRKGVVEVWDQRTMNDPERFLEDEDFTYLQYQLFKSLGS